MKILIIVNIYIKIVFNFGCFNVLEPHTEVPIENISRTLLLDLRKARPDVSVELLINYNFSVVHRSQ